MQLHLYGGIARYEPENICRLFLPHEPITLCDAVPEGDGVRVSAGVQGDTAVCRVMLGDYDRERRAPIVTDDPLMALWGTPAELAVATLLYRQFCELFHTAQPWGLLTGVRPVKLLRRLTHEVGEEQALAYFRERLLCSDEKAVLAQRTLHAEDKILSLSSPQSCSVYLSVPFCPTRCSYCSFVSHTTEKSQHLIPAYVTLLCREIEETGRILRQLGLRLDSLYIGGGTPTTLSASQLEAVMATVNDHLDLSHCLEYTVEAGRPDTVTEEKLRAILAGGATRLSINPQTLHDHVLDTIKQFYDAFSLARKVGFDHINTDLIAGLPTDSLDGFKASVDGILALSPESVTVHTLSMKRASHLVVRDHSEYDAGGETPQMVRYASERLWENGYHPYYLYRQSRCVGNQENTGWSKDGHDGLYNVFMMDETHTVIGCGAGAVTKLKSPDSDYLERVFNFKFPYEYIDRFDEMLERKQQVVTFYESCSDTTDA